MASGSYREPIAVIGMSFRFPRGAETSDDLWKLLVERRCAATEFPRDRFNIDAFWHPDHRRQNTINTREGHFLAGDIRNFDAGFFSMAPHEVAAMDPQHRGLMETTYHAFENAGLRLEDVAGSRTSVHVGCFTSDFATMQFRDVQNIAKYNALGSAGSILANRISWFYDLRGESMYVDTACSSGLVAMALACQGLASGESDLAVVGASNIIFGPEFNVSLSNMNFLSPTGRCHSFDAKGDGYGRGEGFASLILKPVSKAIAGGNPIRALIRSIGMNQDGHTSGGITQPSKDMQVQLIRETYRKAGLDMRHTRFFEAHGTGTAVGDPIEARAIGEAFYQYRSKEDPIYVGAVKSNLGHLEGTSGLAGVVKTILALERGVIPPNTNFETLNPQIDADFFNLKVILEAADGYLRSMGLQKPSLALSVFSMASEGGDSTHSNHFHGVNGDAQGHDCRLNGSVNGLPNGTFQQAQQGTPSYKLLILSASDEDGIARQAQGLSALFTALQHDDKQMLEDVVFTLNTRHTMLEWKSYCTLGTLSQLAEVGQSFSKPVRRSTATTPKLGLVFTGQGAQWPRMGCELLEWPVFKSSLMRSQKFLYSMDEITAHAKDSSVHIPEFSQAISTAVQIALVDLLDSLGIKASVVVGHSSGEIAAAYCAGFLCHESAMRASYFRGVLASRLARDSQSSWRMASIGLSASQFTHELEELEAKNPQAFDSTRITISCINSPSNVTVSGPVACLDVLLARLSSKNVFARKLKVDVGYHSPQMKSVASEYLGHLSNLRPGERTNQVKMVSSVRPGLASADIVCSAAYWVENMVSPVRFVDAMDICCVNGDDGGVTKRLDRSHSREIVTHGWLEVGPHAALKGPLREIFNAHKRSNLPYASLLVRGNPANLTVVEAVGQLFCHNFEVDLASATRLGSIEPREPRIIVDLPRYPFNHSTIYWEESSRSKAFRSRAHGCHPLLGSQAMDWNPLNATWRFFIKSDEIPWVSDHRLHGDMWYPAAGMVVMAVEALKQLLPDGEFDFELQNVSFTGPIVVSDAPDGTETQISMTPASGTRGMDAEYKFRIFVRRMNAWEEVCDGMISPQRTWITLDIVSQKEEEHRRQSAQIAYDNAVEACQSFVDAGEMYRKFSESTGLLYGPAFQPLTHIHYNAKGQAHARLIPLQDVVVEVSRPFTIHPATLDGIFQLAIPALSKGLAAAVPTLVPARLTRLWISHGGAGTSSHGPEVLNCDATFLSRRSAVASAAVFSEADMKLKVQVEELEVTEVARDQSTADSEQVERAICHEMDWKVDPTLLDAAEMRDYCSRRRSVAPEPEQWYEDLRLMLLGFADRALESLRTSKQKPIPSMEKYAEWLQARVDAYRASQPEDQLHTSPFESAKMRKLTARLASSGARGAMNALVGSQLRQILTGETDPLQLLFADPRCLADFYEEVNTTAKAFDMLEAYLDALVHKDPSSKFLEIGAGTGATTSRILDTIANPERGSRCSEYVFTDISGSFFSTAQERFKGYDRIQYRILDIEEDADTQGFSQGVYDVIVAANVLHATKDLGDTLSNVRRLLKPNGKLILVEMTTPDNIETGFVFGSLPGWWLGSEAFRQQSAVFDEDRWDSLLRQAGFSGTEQVFRDWDSEVCHGWSIMVSSAIQAEGGQQSGYPPKILVPNVTLVVDENSQLQIQAAKSLQRKWQCSEFIAEVMTFDQVLTRDDLGARNCILFVDLDCGHLHNAGPVTFQSYQSILTASKSILWVETHDVLSDSPPYWGMIEGLCRVCRSENPAVKIVTLMLESATCLSAEATAKQVAKVFETMHSRDKLDFYEPEYLESSGCLCINRLSQAKYLDRHIFARTHNVVRRREFGSGPPLTLEIRTPGLLDTLEWVEDKAAYAALEPDQVEVRVRAIGVNFKECLTLLGRVNSDTLGSECSGYVSRVGSGIKRLRIGDRVALGSLETYKTLVRAREFQVVKIPDSMSFSDAAAVPTAFCTAYHSLYNVARLQKGESILIHAAAGGTGQAAVQIAQYIGAEIFATVGSADKRKLLIEQYGILDDHIFHSRDASFASGVKRMTNGRGVDVVLNSLSGKLLVASWEIIAEFGRFVEIGRKDIDTRGYLPMFPFIKNAMFAGVDLAAIVDGAGESNRYVLQQVFDLIEAGVLRPSYPVQSYPMDQATQAFRLLQSGKSKGKIVLEIDDNALVLARESADSDYRFSKHATYVVAGGLGGIGRQITRWLVRRGATNILLLARSGPNGNPERSRIISDLESQGVNVQCGICDIADMETLQEVLRVAGRTMPPIKGCFQAAMVIKDRPFSTMSHQEWQHSVRPKVQGSWNLHAALPSDMDFFVMLSSAVGIFGNAGQSNYAAGNTFQDALARYRTAHGQKAVAIDLGMVLGEGFVAERKDIQDRLMRLDLLLPLSQQELFAMFDYYSNPSTHFASVAASQIVTGIELPALIRQSGREIPESLYRTLFRAMHQIIPSAEGPTAGTTNSHDFSAMFAGSPTLAAAGAAVAEALKNKLCNILGIDPKDKTINDRMDSFGVDSLLALEVRNWLAKEMRADLAVYEILGDAKLIDTGLTTARKSEFRQAHWKEQRVPSL
ncbi:hypothetical protein DL762_004174 [Monosporascus cannonballus]|uniref:Carrier domain-containing protein n=1 Tax=Monosporascus cannonballus TaxID=155416 RepID=A0ABY0H900_9PEZI|nr:hypothetical protein DL762_004174 [Monosporascus cannonballus]